MIKETVENPAITPVPGGAAHQNRPRLRPSEPLPSRGSAHANRQQNLPASTAATLPGPVPANCVGAHAV